MTMLDPKPGATAKRGDSRSTTGAAAGTAGGIVVRNGGGHDGRYPGGKGLAGVWQWIVARMPPHATYAEPFAGRAAIARRKLPALQTWLIEWNPETVAWLRGIRMPATTVIQGDGIRWLQHAADQGYLDEESLVYADPPYLLSTRTKKRMFARELSDGDHAELLDVLLGLRCYVMISGYWSDLYARRLQAWHAEKRPAITRGGTMRDEWLWCNFTPADSPGIAVEYSHLGSDYRERERVARKVRRWQRNFLAMAAAEQAAILRGLLTVSGSSNAAAGDKSSSDVFIAGRDGGDLIVADGGVVPARKRTARASTRSAIAAVTGRGGGADRPKPSSV